MNSNSNPLRISAYGLLVFFIGMLFYFYAYFLRIAPSVMINSLMSDFHAGAVFVGMMSACYYVAYTAFQIPSGLLLDRFGARGILSGVIFLCSLGALAFSLSDNTVFLAIAQLLIGLGSAFAFVGVLYLAIRWFPPERVALMMGTTQIACAAGAICSQGPLIFMMQYVSWRQVMMILAAAGILLAMLVFCIVRNPKNACVGNADSVKKIKMFDSLKTVLRRPQTWYMALYAFAIWAPMSILPSLWGVPFLQASAHLSEIHAAEIMSFAWIGLAVGGPLVGFLSDWVGRRCVVLGALSLIGLAGAGVLLYLPVHSIWLMRLLLFSIGFAGAGQVLIFAVVKDNNLFETSGAANGFTNMILISSGIVFAPLVGELLEWHWRGALAHGAHIYSIHSYHQALSILPACFLLAAVISFFFIKETYCRQVVNSPRLLKASKRDLLSAESA